ncbi:queuosine precursor transporter [Aestuariibacter salexigens]|uniref:queuosine precursor transporter n=1 Tax=Aestuariibacter salexigens TaxID=226010 RepID=UPI00041EC623|nr:queuosine precursor transporter [Aestuariibacter salexigens]
MLHKIEQATELHQHRFKYYDLVMVATCVIIVCSNIIGAGKVATVAGFTFGAGILFFPLSYVLGDVLTEVYGYARARRVIWAGFFCAAFAAGMAAFITAIPPADSWNVAVGDTNMQEVFALNFGQAPRIVFASLVAIWAGEIVNAFVMAKMKVASGGRALYQRTIGSTIAGQGVDTLIFYPLAFYGVWSNELLVTVMATNYVLKVLWEALLTPVTYKVVNHLKKVEQVDVFDKQTEFTPFTIKY